MLFFNFIWSLPAKILNYSTNSISQEPKGGRRKSTRRRRRPLHTCGASCVAIVRKACTKAQDLDGPLGSTTKTCITYFNSLCPFVHTAVHRCLALLLIVDDHILSLETRIEGIFPRSSCLFDAVDGLARRAEALPDNLDHMATKLTHTIHHLPLLGWLVGCLSWILASFFRSKNARAAREKEITIDVNSSNGGAAEQTKLVQFEKPYSYADAARNVNQQQGEVIAKSVQFEEKKVPNEVIHLSVKRLHSWKSRIKALEEPLSAGDSPMYSSYQSANTSPVSDCSQEDNHPFNHQLGGCTYKEILEREKKEDDEGEREEEEGKDLDGVVNVHREEQLLY